MFSVCSEVWQRMEDRSDYSNEISREIEGQIRAKDTDWREWG